MSRAEAGRNGKGNLPGYAECHFCTVKNKRKALKCIGCIGRLSLRERLIMAAEEKTRTRTAVVLSLLAPGLGHVYRKSPGTGFFYFFLIGLSIGYLALIEGEMTSGRVSFVVMMAVIYLYAAFDAGRRSKTNVPPCQEACPAGLACALYVGLTREGKFREGLELVQTLCPFPGTVGRVCHHPCEQSCRRAEEGESIAICALKRFLADQAEGEPASFYRQESVSPKRFREKVAVIGGGPSGLSAALYMHLLGFSVTLFEAEDQVGGMPGAVIPDYRLPAFIYKEEIERILALDIEVRTSRRLGDDFTLLDLENEGFAAAYLALGAQRSVRLPHCGTTEEGFLDGLEFLRAAKKGQAGKLRGNVLVIGGGNVAVDVAKTAVRLGADSVRKIFLETRETMPAHRWECEEALEEGVKLISASATISFDIQNGHVVSALCRRVERIDIEDGRIKPVLWEGTDFTLPADWVITAVGNGPDYSVLGGKPKVESFRKDVRAGPIKVADAPRLKVVIGGDYFAGPSSVIAAVASGYEAALEIYRRLHKSRLFRLPRWNRMKRVRFPGYLDEPEKTSRVHMMKVDPEVRCESFCEVCESYEVSSAEREAARCLRCSWPMRPEKGPPVPEERPTPKEEVIAREPGKFF